MSSVLTHTVSVCCGVFKLYKHSKHIRLAGACISENTERNLTKLQLHTYIVNSEFIKRYMGVNAFFNYCANCWIFISPRSYLPIIWTQYNKDLQLNKKQIRTVMEVNCPSFQCAMHYSLHTMVEIKQLMYLQLIILSQVRIFHAQLSF